MKTINTICVAGAALLMASGCVEADPTVLATAHILGDCDSAGGIEVATFDGEPTIVPRVNLDLADLAQGGEGQIVSFSEVEVMNGMEVETVVQANSQTGAFGVNFIGQNQLIPTTEYTSVGYDSELRVDQNQFVLETVEFEVIESAGAPYNLNDLSASLLTSSGGDFAVVNLPLLGPGQVQEWADITTAVAQNTGIVPVTVEAKMVGSLIDGTSAESNVVRIEMLVCNGCGIPTTPLCTLSD